MTEKHKPKQKGMEPVCMAPATVEPKGRGGVNLWGIGIEDNVLDFRMVSWLSEGLSKIPAAQADR